MMKSITNNALFHSVPRLARQPRDTCGCSHFGSLKLTRQAQQDDNRSKGRQENAYDFGFCLAYVLCTCLSAECPELVLKSLESMRASFFWGSNGDKRKLAWIKWDNILASFDKGGLEIGSLKLLT
ncbi:hypothetical protein Tco_1334060 [Tanacetum coccineum]